MMEFTLKRLFCYSMNTVNSCEQQGVVFLFYRGDQLFYYDCVVLLAVSINPVRLDIDYY
jgi:hypothetical protein